MTYDYIVDWFRRYKNSLIASQSYLRTIDNKYLSRRWFHEWIYCEKCINAINKNDLLIDEIVEWYAGRFGLTKEKAIEELSEVMTNGTDKTKLG